MVSAHENRWSVRIVVLVNHDENQWSVGMSICNMAQLLVEKAGHHPPYSFVYNLAIHKTLHKTLRISQLFKSIIDYIVIGISHLNEVPLSKD